MFSQVNKSGTTDHKVLVGFFLNEHSLAGEGG